MKFLTNLFVFFCLVIVSSVCFAEDILEDTNSSAQAGMSDEISLPYVAEIVADNVNIRSGPGTNYYSCGKLNKNTRVKVIAHKYSWSHIVPPKGCFSWVSKQYVTVDSDNPAIGIVTGDAVRIYAGSQQLKPIHSTTLQLKLNKGDKVKLLGEGKDDYYKIASPQGAYLWVSTKYTKALGSVEEYPLEINSEPGFGSETVVLDTPAADFEAEKLKEYYALEGQMKAELVKPIDKQDYSAIKQGLSEIAADKEAGRAARYADFALKKIARFDLALVAANIIRLQDANLKKTSQRIAEARIARLAAVKDLGRFAAVGILQASQVYGAEAGTKRYRIISDSGKTICYALPVATAWGLELDELIGRKVGLIGTIQPHPQTAGALVEFTELVELK